MTCCPDRSCGLLLKLVLALACAALNAGPSSSGELPDMDSWIAGLEGGWAGEDNMTPVGRMPFALLFEWEDDGSLHARTAINAETYMDLRFRKDEQGRWLLDEEGGIEGLGVQAHTLIPAESSGDVHRWFYPNEPGYLTVDVGVHDDMMFMKVLVRGEDHAQFQLKKMAEEALPALRDQLAHQAARPPAEGASIADFGNHEQIPEPIRSARAAVAAQPEDAGVHMQLAGALSAEIQANPSVCGPRYAFELLEALQTALELDPTLPDAYRGLAGYYLHAPPIAGGSLDKAEEMARKLLELDPQGGKALLAQVEQRRGGSSAASDGSR